MTLAKEAPEASTDTTIAVVEVVDTEEDVMDTAPDATTMIVTVDTAEDVIATMTDLASTVTEEEDAMTARTTDVEVAADTEVDAITTEEEIVEETVMVDVAMVHHRPNMAIQLQSLRLENLMVVGSLMTEASPVANTKY